MNIAVIEDELLTLEDMVEMIGKIDPSIRIVATLTSVHSAIEYFNQPHTLDLVFSDIQLGDGLSFEIFRRSIVTPPIIFCTAYDEYSLEAIRNNGIEYILKPFTMEAIAAAIEKYRRLKNHFVPLSIDFEKLIRTITGEKPADKKPGSILIYHRDKVLPVSPDDIALFYSENELTHLHCFNGSNYIVTQSLEQLEQQWPHSFFRISRQFLVNRRAIRDATHYSNRKYVVNLSIHFNQALVVSKNRTTGFLEWLKN